MIAASFLGIKENLETNLKKLDDSSISYLHFDIMDGKFVPNKTWKVNDLLPLVKDLKKPFDVHFMVEDVKSYIEEFDLLHPEYMTFHLEAVTNPNEIIERVKHTGSKVGISIKPNTSVESLLPFLEKIDLVLVMSVEPGKGGQSFIESSISKIEQLNQLRKEKHYHYVIEVDGGMNPETKKRCEEAGTDIFVVGSYITNHENYQEQIEKLK